MCHPVYVSQSWGSPWEVLCRFFVFSTLKGSSQRDRGPITILTVRTVSIAAELVLGLNALGLKWTEFIFWNFDFSMYFAVSTHYLLTTKIIFNRPLMEILFIVMFSNKFGRERTYIWVLLRLNSNSESPSPTNVDSRT